MKRQLNLNTTTSPILQGSISHISQQELDNPNLEDMPIPACDFSQTSLPNSPKSQSLVGEQLESANCEVNLLQEDDSDQSIAESVSCSPQQVSQNSNLETGFIKRPSSLVQKSKLEEKSNGPLPHKIHPRLRALSKVTLDRVNQCGSVNTTIGSDLAGSSGSNFATNSPLLQNKFLLKLHEGAVETSSPIYPRGAGADQAPISSTSSENTGDGQRITADSGFAVSVTVGQSYNSINIKDVSSINQKNPEDSGAVTDKSLSFKKSSPTRLNSSNATVYSKRVLAESNEQTVFKFPPPQNRKRLMSSCTQGNPAKRAHLLTDIENVSDNILPEVDSYLQLNQERKNSGLTGDFSSINLSINRKMEETADTSIVPQACDIGTPRPLKDSSLCHTPVSCSTSSIQTSSLFKSPMMIDNDSSDDDDEEELNDSDLTADNPLAVLQAAGASIAAEVGEAYAQSMEKRDADRNGAPSKCERNGKDGGTSEDVATDVQLRQRIHSAGSPLR